jgi:polysaccharide biosynthesis protein PslH
MADLFVSAFGPALGSGRALRMYTCIRALAVHGPVDLLYLPHEGEEPAPEYAAIEGLRFHPVHQSRGARRAAIYAGRLLRGVPSSCCRGLGPELIEAAERMARAPGRGRVIVGDEVSAGALWSYARRSPLVYNANNIEYERESSPLRRAHMRAFERRLLRHVAEAWMVSSRDLEQARELAPRTRLRYVPNVVDVARIRPVARGKRGERLLMVGDFTYAPNISGRDFLLAEVLPRVRRELPAARVALVGRGLDGWRPEIEGVDVAGFVPDLAAAYADADCVVVPLVEGAGSPLKFVEALAYGMPIVATPRAARGLAVEPGVHYRLGRDADELAAAIVATLRDGGAQLATAARALAEQEYSVASLIAKVAP